MTKPTPEQLRDPEWWDENAPIEAEFYDPEYSGSEAAWVKADEGDRLYLSRKEEWINADLNGDEIGPLSGMIPRPQTNRHHLSTSGDVKSGPEWGEIVHFDGDEFVVIDSDELEKGFIEVADRQGITQHLPINGLEEYKPDPTQQLRHQILEDWQKQGLDFAHDDLTSKARLGQFVEFMVKEGYHK